jgi:restriction endonuclease
MQEVIEKINKDIFERSMKNNFKLLPNMGRSTHEFEYRKCKSSVTGLENYIFVVSKKLYYNNGSLVNYKHEVYAYDSDGNYIEDSSVYEKCRGNFFQNLIDI